MPVTSQPEGPTRKRRISFGRGRRQHLVVAHAGEVAAVGVAAVGLDPQPAEAVEGQAVGLLNRLSGVMLADGARAGDRRLPGQHEDVPVEAQSPWRRRRPRSSAGCGPRRCWRAGWLVHRRAGEPAEVLPSAALDVGGAAAPAVVGQRDVDLAAASSVLAATHSGPVHHRRADAVAGLARLDHHLGLARRSRWRRQPVLAEDQRHPHPGAHVVARGRAGVERATYSVPSSSRRRLAALVGLAVEGAGGDELVDVLVALVVAHVDDDLAVGGDHQLGVLVLEAAQRGALDGLGVRANGSISTTQPKRLRLVGRDVGVEARIHGVPAVAEAVLW
jgi:hypothetical protein